MIRAHRTDWWTETQQQPAIIIITIVISAFLHTELFLSYFCCISDTYDLGHSLVVFKSIYLAAELRYELVHIKF